MLTRQLRMKGMNVLMPMGWDAFGLPAENAAMKNKVPPAKWTYDNIADMKAQMQAMGLAIDWSREVATCSPDYYKWNQWLFLKMLEAGIAERRTQVVNWDPVDQTVLANEQVIDGRGWRSRRAGREARDPGLLPEDHAVRRRTARACRRHRPARLARARQADAGELDRQERGRALRVPAPDPRRRRPPDRRRPLYVFTTRADTIMGVTFCAVAPEHPLALHAAALRPGGRRVHRRVQDRRHHRGRAGAAGERRASRPACVVEHPLTHEPIPVWVGNYVLMSYGDGAVMGVPGHDERDFAFAKKYGIDILQVIHVDGEPHFTYDHWQDWYALKDDKRRARRDDQLRHLQRPGVPGRDRCDRRLRSSTAGSAARSPPGGCATGASAGSATGARRSRSSTARHAAWCRCPKPTCRSCCRKT